MTSTDESRGRLTREATFWDEHTPAVEECIREYHKGPDANTVAMLDAVEPLEGNRVLDFACGAGVTSAWLAARGAIVTGLDLSAASTARAAEFCRCVGLDVTFLTGRAESAALGDLVFDRIVGRYALHHVDSALVGRALAEHLAPEGKAAFLETVDRNPILRFARRHFVGRYGIPRYGTLDEHPLTDRDLAELRCAFGDLRTVVSQMTFFAIFDRQVLRYRSARATRLLAALDEVLRKMHLHSWSYQQVLLLSRRPTRT